MAGCAPRVTRPPWYIHTEYMLIGSPSDFEIPHIVSMIVCNAIYGIVIHSCSECHVHKDLVNYHIYKA
jgi:hypothetical protein